MKLISKNYYLIFLILVFNSCDNDKNKEIERLSKEIQSKAKDIKKLSTTGVVKSTIKTATGTMALGVLTAFVYDAVKPQSINSKAQVLSTDYPFFATNENNDRIPVEAGSYTIINESNSYITINGHQNEVLLVKR